MSAPPRRLEALLERVLVRGLSGEATVGDLAEAYARRRARMPRWRCDLWYAAQASTLLLHALVRRGTGAVRSAGSGIRADVRAAGRGLVRRPASSAGILLTLGLGLGANAAVLRVADGTLRATSWWSEADATWALWPDRLFSRGELWTFAQETPPGFLVGGYRTEAVSVDAGDARPSSLAGAVLSPALFERLRVRPIVGRGLVPEDAEPGAEPVIVLHESYWRRELGADPGVVGSRIEVNGLPRTIVGIQGADGSAPGAGTRAWLPLVMDPSDPEFFPAYDVRAVAVAPAGMDGGGVRAELRRFTAGMAARYPFFYPPDFGESATVESAAAREQAPLRTPLLLLLAGTGALLLVAALNVGNLLLTRSIERGPELAVRRALGADRARVVRQLALEAAVLAGLALAVGLAVATPVSATLALLFPADVPVVAGSWRAGRLWVALAAALGAVWALLTLVPVAHFLRSDRRGVGSNVRASTLAPRGLVALQTAAATTLLVAATLLVGSIQALRQVPLGFEPDDVTVAQIPLPASLLADRDRLRQVQEALAERVRTLPGVEAAGLTQALPLLEAGPGFPVNAEDRPVEVSVAVRAARVAIGPGYLDALGVPVLRGRALGRQERGGGPTAVLVNEALARTLWPSEDAVGRRVAVDPHAWEAWVEVVGVVADVRSEGLLTPAPPTFYVALYELPVREATLVVRGGAGGTTLARGIRDAVAAVDATVPVGAIRPMGEVVRDAYGEAWVTMGLLAVLAVLATALAGLGVHAVLAHAVALRRRELGVRLALGAGRGRLVAGVLRSGLVPAAVGGVVGCLVAAVGGDLVRGLLVDVSVLEPAAFGLALGVVLSVAAAAAVVPALRAGALAPVEVMRDE